MNKFLTNKIIPAFAVFTTFFSMTLSVFGDYPLIYHKFGADPTGLEYNGRLYLYGSNDTDNDVNGGYNMHSITCISSDDLKNWTDHGEVLHVSRDVSWAANSWAPSVITNNGLFYMYFANNASGIGVATSSVPTGPFKDARGSALIDSSTPGADAPNQWLFDPCVFIDDDHQVYLYFGGQYPINARVILLNTNMTSVSGSATPMTASNFFEASMMHKRGNTYYYSYSAGSTIQYETDSNPTSGFVFKGTVLPNPPYDYNNNNHHSFFTYKGVWYCTYHNRYLATMNGLPTGFKRNVCLDVLNFNADGTMQQVVCTSNGLTQLKYLNPCNQVEAETMAQDSGITAEVCSEGGMDVGRITNSSWIKLTGVDFGSGASSFYARVASAGSGGNIELRLDSLTGTLIGTCTVTPTGGWQTWTTASCGVSGATGVHDLYLKFTGASGNLFNVNWWQFQACFPDIQVSIPATAKEGDGTLAGKGSLSTAIPAANDRVVNLTSSNTNKVTVPASVVIPAGQSNAVFDLTIIDNSLLDGDQVAIITATLLNCSNQATIMVHDNDTATLSVTLPASASKSAGTLVNAGAVSVGTPVPANFTVSLSSSDPSKLIVPPTTVLPKGQTSAVFSVTVVDNNIIDGPQNVSVTAHVPNWTNGSASMTILDDNPLPDHFAWSVIPSPQLIGEPFRVTITALDDSGNIVDYRLPVTLSALIPGSAAKTNTLLNSPGPQQSTNDGFDCVVGYSFTAATNLYVTHVRHYFGDNVSIWSDSGQLLAAQDVVSISGTWVDTPLSTPLFIAAGATCRIVVHEYNIEYFWGQNLPGTFADGTINQSCWDFGVVFPTQTDDARWYYVDLRYGTDFAPASINPVATANFNAGTWSGNIAVLQAATNVYLLAGAGAGHSGASVPFNVIGKPVLEFELYGDIMLITWPVASPAMVLEVSDSLSPAIWVTAPYPPLQFGGLYVVPVEMSAPQNFYRLRYVGY